MQDSSRVCADDAGCTQSGFTCTAGVCGGTDGGRPFPSFRRCSVNADCAFRNSCVRYDEEYDSPKAGQIIYSHPYDHAVSADDELAAECSAP